MRRRPAVLVAVLVALCGAMTACGVSSDAAPRDIPPGEVPFALVAAPSPTDDSPTEGGVSGQIFLVDAQGLKAVGRQLAPQDNALVAVEKLLGGPTQEEASQGLRTAIPTTTRLLAVDLRDGVLTVDLSNDFLVVQGSEQRTAVAQLVFTATDTPDVDSVRFAIEGTLREVPIDDGSLSAQPLTRFSYPSLDPTKLPPPTPGGALPTTTTTTTTIPATTAAAPPTS